MLYICAMKMMRAAYIVKHGKAHEAFEIRETAIPTAGPGQVLIKSEVFGLNFAEVPMRYGMYREAPPLPFIPGYDMVGRVEAVGQGVDPSWIGKRVAAMARFGTYAEYCVTVEPGISEIPEDLAAGAASAIGVQYTTAYYSAIFSMNLLPGDKVLIHAGAGGVGSALIQLCKWKGCEIFTTVGSKEKEERVRALGADHVINYRETDYLTACKKLLAGKRLEATFNAIGGSSFKKDMQLLGSGGRLVLYGAAERMGQKGGKLATLAMLWKMGFIMPIMLMAKSRSVIGVNILKLADYRPQVITTCFRELMTLLDQGIIEPQMGGEFAIDELAKAHNMLENRQTMGKVVVRW